MFENARWIWHKDGSSPDQYLSFKQKFTASGKPLTLRVCAETNYIAYLNGKRVAFGQFAGYKTEKYFDEILLDDCKKGENLLEFTVFYEGVDSATHIADKGGIIYSVLDADKEVCFSNCKDVVCGLHTGYIHGRKKHITVQLGYTSGMTARGTEIIYETPVEVDLTHNLLPRPVKKLLEEDTVYGKLLDVSGREIYDLGRETAGYLVLEIESEGDSDVAVVYGEHLKDGCVRYSIGGREFSLDFKCKNGNNKFEQLFVRVAGRYLEVFTNGNAKIKNIGLIPVIYPQEERENFLSGIEKDIYDVCVRTLRLCMHEHYEDCPWREQALYVLDGRNQMLCGYYAFKDSSFQRANLVFISKGKRADGLLELTYPAVNTPAIPFFSVMYPVAVWEYVEHTKDQTLLDEVMPSALEIMEVFRSKIGDNGLIADFTLPYWNFYEWSQGADGSIGENLGGRYDLILNCAFLYSYERFKKLCDIKGITFDVGVEKMKRAIKDKFYDSEKGKYFLSDHGERVYSQLGNAFALLVGLSGKNLVNAVRGEGVVPATLSMLGYVYDALLVCEGNEQFVLDDIKEKYVYMLNEGATSVWETILGDADFDNAGSLCHGWSAMPIYFYNKLLRRKS